MKKNRIIIFILLLLLAVLYLFEFLKLDKNLVTIFDEGYYFLTLLKAKNAEPHIGISQWPYFITSVFNTQILSDIYCLRIVRFLFRIFTFTSFFLIIAPFVKKQSHKNSIVVFLLIVASMSYFSIGDMIITYNYLQEFFILMVASFALLSLLKKNSAYLLFSGLFSFFAILVIPPSGVFISFLTLLLVIVVKLIEKESVYKVFLYYFGGFVLSITLVHYFIVDLNTIYNNIFVGTKDLISANRGYGPIDHLIRLFFYLRDFFIQNCLLLGLFYLATIIALKTKPYVKWLIFMAGLFIFFLYVKKPDFSISTLWAFPMVLFVVELIKSEQFSLSNLLRNNLSKTIINIFIFVLPLVSVLGTNTPYAGKMLVFILPWSFLLFQLFFAKATTPIYKALVPIVIIVPLFFNIAKATEKNKSTKEFFNEGPVCKMKLKENQFQYFQRVDSLFKLYNFSKNNDYVFATTFDHMTIVAFQAKAIGTFQLPEDFLQYKNKEKLMQPKFIFMTEYDKTMLSEEFSKLSWGFPEDYDQFFIGTPDPQAIWKSDRWLYCKKNK